jgi:hypothetical protein
MDQLVFDQLKWIERRRIRILGAVASSHDRQQVMACVNRLSPPIAIFDLESNLSDLIDEAGPSKFLRELAYKLEFNESRMIAALILNFPEEATRKTILVGSRYSGQEAARNLMAHISRHSLTNLVDIYSSIYRLTYSGIPADKISFVSIRPLSDVSIHYSKCAHSKAWLNSGADMSFLCDVQKEWLSGALDIIAPEFEHIRLSSIAKGASYGRDRFVSREKIGFV